MKLINFFKLTLSILCFMVFGFIVFTYIDFKRFESNLSSNINIYGQIENISQYKNLYLIIESEYWEYPNDPKCKMDTIFINKNLKFNYHTSKKTWINIRVIKDEKEYIDYDTFIKKDPENIDLLIDFENAKITRKR